jgi:tRNA-Thr(GGU) m(6)t(6)A37 methyltransferase TsaA
MMLSSAKSMSTRAGSEVVWLTEVRGTTATLTAAPAAHRLLLVRSRGVHMNDRQFDVRPIGQVESRLTDVAAAPSQGDEGAPDAWIVVQPEFRRGVRDLTVGERIIVLTWLDRGDRSVLELHPRDDPTRPLTGVFSTRSSDRPNPIGLHEVEILATDGARLHVRPLEAVDGTPVIDIKPALGPRSTR